MGPVSSLAPLISFIKWSHCILLPTGMVVFVDYLYRMPLCEQDFLLSSHWVLFIAKVATTTWWPFSRDDEQANSISSELWFLRAHFTSCAITRKTEIYWNSFLFHLSSRLKLIVLNWRLKSVVCIWDSKHFILNWWAMMLHVSYVLICSSKITYLTNQKCISD